MNTLILGGAGFVGSNLARHFAQDIKNNVVIVDGLLEHTGGKPENLPQGPNVSFYQSRIEDLSEIERILANIDLVVDSMAWTSHLAAMKDPLYDLDLNLNCHLHFIEHLKRFPHLKVIYLGSRGQYGNPQSKAITESTPQEPVDVQGIHKTAAESHYRLLARNHGLMVASLRFGNCYGPNQKIEGDDLGLIGGFIRDALANKEIVVFGQERSRNIVFVGQIVEAVSKISEKTWDKFEAFNVAGIEISIYDLACRISRISQQGKVILKEISEEIRRIDMNPTVFSDQKLRSFLGDSHLKPLELDSSLELTLSYFKRKLG